MVVVMTGSPGGAIGGNSGGSFGSGLLGMTVSPKPTSPSLETWSRRAEEDVAMVKERHGEYDELKDSRLTTVSAQQKQEKSSRKKAEEEYAARQKERQEKEDAELARVKAHRLEALDKPTLGSPEPPWAQIKGCPATPAEHLLPNTSLDPSKWLWPTSKRNPELVVRGLRAEHEEAMEALPRNVEPEVLVAYSKSISANSQDLTKRATETRRHQDEEKAQAEAKEKKEREDAANAIRAEERKKRETAQKAAVSHTKQIKKEMAAETKKQQEEAARKAKVRYEKAQTERAEMVRHLTTDMRMRDEDEIANERREGSSMSKGGKADFVASAAQSKSDMSGF